MTDKEYAGLSKEEIARQFMLPERKSKIATLLKQDGQAYCICRTSDSSRFMIGCDSCEEWYHGDCICITEKEAKYIKQFFCIRCREEDPTLQTRYKPRKREGEKTTPTTEERKIKRRKERLECEELKPKAWSKRCGRCLGCYRTEDCGRCAGCRDPGRGKVQCLQRLCANLNTTREQKSPRTPRQSRKRKDSSSEPERGGAGGGGGRQQVVNHRPRQCYGPSCTALARPGSKYCSEDCGIKLATNRIYQVLPQRIQEWTLSPCVAEESNKRALDTVRKHQLEVRRILQELDKRHKELDVIIERARRASIDPRSEEDVEEGEGEMSMYCLTCGHEIHSRMAVRHMEKCFNKYESQSSFGSIYKTRIEGNNMFCDFYNPLNSTYCKRLRVLCPEHSKDARPGDAEVCGCPLVTNVFDPTGEFCRAAKKSCLRHHVWEKLRRAEIDMERVRQWLKIDELIEQERQIRHMMASRAGVLALMLHSTYNHELMERMTSEEMQRQYDLQQEQQQ